MAFWQRLVPFNAPRSTLFVEALYSKRSAIYCLVSIGPLESLRVSFLVVIVGLGVHGRNFRLPRVFLGALDDLVWDVHWLSLRKLKCVVNVWSISSLCCLVDIKLRSKTWRVYPEHLHRNWIYASRHLSGTSCRKFRQVLKNEYFSCWKFPKYRNEDGNLLDW
jgi:hypothetical protein